MFEIMFLHWFTWEQNSKQRQKFTFWDEVLVFATHQLHDILFMNTEHLFNSSLRVCNVHCRLHQASQFWISTAEPLESCWLSTSALGLNVQTFIFSIRAPFSANLEGRQMRRWFVMNFHIFKLQALAVVPPSDLLVLDLLAKFGGFSCRGLQWHSKDTTNRSNMSADNFNRAIDN